METAEAGVEGDIESELMAHGVDVEAIKDKRADIG